MYVLVSFSYFKLKRHPSPITFGFCIGSHDADLSVMYRTLKATTTFRQQDVAVPRRAVAVVPPDRKLTPKNVNNSSRSSQRYASLSAMARIGPR